MADEFHEDPYDDSVKESSDDLLDYGEISPEEKGFLKGYDEAYNEEKIDKEFE